MTKRFKKNRKPKTLRLRAGDIIYIGSKPALGSKPDGILAEHLDEPVIVKSFDILIEDGWTKGITDTRDLPPDATLHHSNHGLLVSVSLLKNDQVWGPYFIERFYLKNPDKPFRSKDFIKTAATDV